ncbi:hypothetical protein ABIE26_000740 [Pedobacter africanus]|uniref:Uncharacterized protein n=1 Tax=Pedobacter africanus TaxID=151894 RepID=A0ACC6KTT2_9SPHI|nr:hypothetical protein [Pedobacter africanus]MDR6782773.1 hypothetical protein [Pedobacter africanus]
MSHHQELQTILNQISEAKTYYQVDILINSLTTLKTAPAIQTLAKLENELENLSPLTVTSGQWSSLRYALICLRKINANLKSQVRQP